MPPAAPTLVELTESTALAEAAAGAPAHRFRARLIESDVWGSSGYYSRQVLEEAVANDVFPDQLPIYLDHPGLTERSDRPERSVRDLAGKLVGGSVLEADGIYSDIEVYPHVAPLIEAMVDDIGMSIRADGQVEHGEAEGRSGLIVTSIDEAISVDFVTAAGAGGKVVSLLESARVNRRAIGHGIEEATVNDRREALSGLLKDAYGAEKTYVWLRDFDDSTAWFEIEGPTDAPDCYAQAYTSTEDGTPTALDGDRTEVRVTTTYVPVTPAGQSTTEESEEDTMPQIEEARLRELEEAAGRVTQIETQLSEAETARDAALDEVANMRTQVREARVDAIIAEADVTFDDLQVAGLRATAPIEEGVLDEDAFRTSVTEAAAKVAEANGAGKVRGFGAQSTSSAEDEKALDDARGRAFGRKGA